MSHSSHDFTSPAEREAFLQKFLAGESVSAIAREFDRSRAAVARVLRLNGIKASPVAPLRGLHDEIVALYATGKSTYQLASEYGVHRIAIRNVLLQTGVTIRTKQRHRLWSVNGAFFDSIDTEAKAYVLGFFAADGHCDRRGAISFELAQRDTDHLKLIASLLESNAPISYRTSHKIGRNGKPFVSDTARIRFCSRQFVTALDRFGWTGNKTSRCKPPPLSPENMRHFFRGLWDGDGSIGSVRMKKGGLCWQVSQCGNQFMVSAFSAFVHANTGILVTPRSYQSNVWHAQYMGNRYPKTVARLLQQNATIFLARKRTKYEELLRWKT